MRILQTVKRGGTYVVTGVTTAFASGAVLAADQTAAITAAQTEGTANVTAVIGAVLAISILGFGVGALIKWFNK